MFLYWLSALAIIITIYVRPCIFCNISFGEFQHGISIERKYETTEHIASSLHLISLSVPQTRVFGIVLYDHQAAIFSGSKASSPPYRNSRNIEKGYSSRNNSICTTSISCNQFSSSSSRSSVTAQYIRGHLLRLYRWSLWAMRSKATTAFFPYT